MGVKIPLTSRTNNRLKVFEKKMLTGIGLFGLRREVTGSSRKL
jgi:hypothetical protein